ncbi:Alpha/Beta hydrolase protein [Lasiosphaeris hirsuta]|uniref:Alpha/Beta hydrolase protein n=1 Tax=Lasiosphaeris hirsuta TaxID=260670 RepID=A0AA40AQ52_9PEZI|nr:Alpha/Beta hydrolase protein [Lasiosphaeris hirsuta]
MTPTRTPTSEDFTLLLPHLTLSLVPASPPESTTAILLLFHGLGDAEPAFASFARSLALPGVLAISVRGTSPLPPALLGLPLDAGPTNHFHWGDDLTLGSDGELDQDPGFEKAMGQVLGRLIGEVLIGKCGWETQDILLFGYGQGGSLALGLASRLRLGVVEGEGRVTEAKEGGGEEAALGKGPKAFKGVVSIGGALPASIIPSISAREKSRTPVLVCHGSKSEAIDEVATDVLKHEFADVKMVEWKRPDDGPPRNSEEVLPMMEFFSERLRSVF